MSPSPCAENLLPMSIHITPEELHEELCHDVRIGLLRKHDKHLSPVWFYDQRGSYLFDQITKLPEYYLTRAETALLEDHASVIAEQTRVATLIELGAGTCTKSRFLLNAFSELGSLRHYVPIDISAPTLWNAANVLALEYSDLSIHPVVGDFRRHADKVEHECPAMLAFLGSTIGNLRSESRREFLSYLSRSMHPGDTLLIGVDLVKDVPKMVAAYDDSSGVTAAFNRNVLSVLNNELGADFNLANYEHVVVWNEHDSCIEMRLKALRAGTVKVAELGEILDFSVGEEILTETSAKFTSVQLRRELEASGFMPLDDWESPSDGFLLMLASL
ncbi:MAG: L-histidine N(alpha)-methyltransferase [Actinobacteria bacterium]|nr:L-histidine N(alpha)-methyltransferase [Actinomycetota bacterium]